MKHFVLFVLTVFSISLFSQNSLSGKITNMSGEPLIGASVFFSETKFATISDEQGMYQFDNLPKDSLELKVTYISYNSHLSIVHIEGNQSLNIELSSSILNMDEIEVWANKLDLKSPFSYSEYQKEDIELENLGQDLPFLLEQSPSVVVTSDAGAGIGYTSMRVRGSDATRVNVTINGVPLNDSESHNVFWVNMPDFASSVDKIQLQRGVGPSTNGTAAFGATLSLNTGHIHQNPFIKISGTYGSFNTQKVTANFGTGLLSDGYSVEGRYSIVKSDGYIDRATSNLNSWYFSAAKVQENYSLRLNAFSGKERTYQSWYGVPEAKITGDQDALMTHYLNNVGSTYQTVEDSINLFVSDRNYNYYTWRNQVDDYRQTHVQLIYNLKASDKLNINATAHYTKGKGFFEQYKNDQDLVDYNLQPRLDASGILVTNSDLVRRKWLDNDFYGLIVNTVYDLSNNVDITFGGGLNRYSGGHFGIPVFSEKLGLLNQNFRYYENNSIKNDLNLYLKSNIYLNQSLNLFADIQVRKINYSAIGINDDLLNINIHSDFNFFNPKFGINYSLDKQSSIYLSFARGHREPIRSDFIDAVGTTVPEPESLTDFELGYRMSGTTVALNANLYFMKYNNQLVQTGALNDVGGAVRQNVEASTRVGLEIDGLVQLNSQFSLSANVTYSKNKIDNFSEFVPDYTNGMTIENKFEDTNIAFSPNWVSGTKLSYKHSDKFSSHWVSKYVGQQFLDNTSNENRKLDAYWINDLIFAFQSKASGINEFEIKLMVNNIFDVDYSSNGYTFNYVSGDLIEENYYYPQAGINFLLGGSFTF